MLVSTFSNTSVPVFFSEYGCNQPYPRVFTEVPALYGPVVTPVLSGGLVYEYSQETSNYGLVTLNSDGTADLLADYDTLQKQFSTINGTALQGMTASNTTNSPPDCAASLISDPGFSNNFTIPAVPSGVQALIDNGIQNPPVGKIIPVTATKVTQQVKGSGGNTIQGLAITPLADDQSNNPGTASASPTSSAPPAATTSKKAGAPSVRVSLAMLVGMAALVAGCTC